MANYVPTMTKQDLLELREILKKTIQETKDEAKGLTGVDYVKATIHLPDDEAELEDVEDRLKEIKEKEK
jgi:translation elongation factor EF-1beta